MLARQNNLSENSKWPPVMARTRPGAGLSQLGPPLRGRSWAGSARLLPTGGVGSW